MISRLIYYLESDHEIFTAGDPFSTEELRKMSILSSVTLPLNRVSFIFRTFKTTRMTTSISSEALEKKNRKLKNERIEMKNY